VIPTRNEAANLPELLPRLLRAMDAASLAGEVVVADDASPDGTAGLAASLLGARGIVLRRTRDPGLAPAVIEGFMAARAGLLCVMDADLSHPPELVPELVRALRAGADLAVASRYVPGGGVEGWPRRRRWMSLAACRMAGPLTPVRDATSGFFAFRRPVIEGVPLSARGFKIGLEVFVKGRHARWVEVPYVFRDRRAGESKLGSRVALQYLLHLARLAAWKLARRGAR
jgi:dolichol-phosphate mannosyltransferase